MLFPTFTERYFPPAGNTAHASRDTDATHTWFPWHLLTDQLGRCSSAYCDQPTAYLLATPGENRAANTTCCTPACEEHVCDLARIVDDHTRCPKCHYTWTESGDGAKAEPAGITPDEVKRLRLEPEDTLILRVRDTWTPNQIREYQHFLTEQFPDNHVLVLPAEQVLTAGPGEAGARMPLDQNPGEPLGIVTLEWSIPPGTAPFVVPAELVVRDAQSGEALVGLTRLRMDVDMAKAELTVTTTEIVGESGNPIRQGNQHEQEAPTGDGRDVKTVTRRCALASRLLSDADYAGEVPQPDATVPAP